MYLINRSVYLYGTRMEGLWILKLGFGLPYSEYCLLWNLPCFLTVNFWLDASSSESDLNRTDSPECFSLQRGLLKWLWKALCLTVTLPSVRLVLHRSVPAACVYWYVGVIKAKQMSEACKMSWFVLSTSISNVNLAFRCDGKYWLGYLLKYFQTVEKLVWLFKLAVRCDF